VELDGPMKAIPRTGFLAFVTLLALAVPANAGPFEDGLAAYQRGDYATSLRLWRPLAEQGDARAQNNFGLIFDRGQGVPQDYREAMRWYRKAAEQGFAGAQFNLGIMYANGQGVQRDFVVAHMWFILAAASGDGEAQMRLPAQKSKMTPDQIAKSQRMAREWMAKHQQ
jgi:TPR repeat protein